MTEYYEEALVLWESIGDDHELANAYYNASFRFAVPLTTGTGIDSDPEKIGLGYLERAREIFHRLGVYARIAAKLSSASPRISIRKALTRCSGRWRIARPLRKTCKSLSTGAACRVRSTAPTNRNRRC